MHCTLQILPKSLCSYTPTVHNVHPRCAICSHVSVTSANFTISTSLVPLSPLSSSFLATTASCISLAFTPSPIASKLLCNVGIRPLNTPMLVTNTSTYGLYSQYLFCNACCGFCAKWCNFIMGSPAHQKKKDVEENREISWIMRN